MMTISKKIASVFGVFALMISSATAAETLNSSCPVSGKDIDTEKTTTHEVQFCCDKCKGKFDSAPKDHVKKVAEAEAGKCPISGKPVDDEVVTEVSIGFCCGKCQSKFEDDPAKFRKKLK
jgi:YHS domain-containing protein